MILEKYGFNPEMGHKEVGGVKASLNSSGEFHFIMEQLEVDWKYSDALQGADYELIARILIKEIFRLHGLDVSFDAKPLQGVAGSGEHTHVNAVANLKDGRKINLFTPADMSKDYLSKIGWGCLMGIMKHYNIISPFVSATTDAFERLTPGFEAPTHAVASIGMDVLTPSRNRSVLLGLVRSMDNKHATRFVLRTLIPTHISALQLYISQCSTVSHMFCPQTKIPRHLRQNSSSLTARAATTSRRTGCTVVRMIFSRTWIRMNVTGSSVSLPRMYTILYTFLSPTPTLIPFSAMATYSTR